MKYIDENGISKNMDDSSSTFLKDKFLILLFFVYLKKHKCEELLVFWLKVEKLKKNFKFIKLEQFQTIVKGIYNLYLDNDAPLEINIEESSKLYVKQRLDQHDETIFDRVLVDIFPDLWLEHFKTFKNSFYYKKLYKYILFSPKLFNMILNKQNKVNQTN